MKIIIVGPEDLPIIPQYNDLLVIHQTIKLVDEFHVEYQNTLIEFAYLIAYHESYLLINKQVPIMMDGNVVVTNWVGQSSLENIYIGNYEKAVADLFSND